MFRKILFIVALFPLQNLLAQNLPVAVNDTFTISENQTVTLPVAANDYDVDGDPLSISILIHPNHGTATPNGTSVIYVPNANYTGTDSFVYVICDTANLCDTAIVYLNILGGNNPPTAQNDYYTIQKNTPVILPVTANDFDPDGDVLTLTIITPPAHGTAGIINGTQITYNPDLNYYGNDTLVYVICDSLNQCDTAFVFIHITGSNQPPTANDLNFEFSDTLTSTTLTFTITDPEGDSTFVGIAIDIDSLNNLGSLFVANGELQFQRNGIECGTETFLYAVCDVLACDTGQITITIVCPENIETPEGFSPDGDGINDLLVFKDLAYFSPASLKVFNRYGGIVYESTDYQNDWNGTYIENGKAVPDGTYFYILQITDKRKYHNYLVIHR